MFRRTKIPKPNIPEPLEFTWITAEISNKQNVTDSECPHEMLWVKLIKLFIPERYKSTVRTGKFKN